MRSKKTEGEKSKLIGNSEEVIRVVSLRDYLKYVGAADTSPLTFYLLLITFLSLPQSLRDSSLIRGSYVLF